eukprot:6797927-Alexandrium_andersonii.AAC.1
MDAGGWVELDALCSAAQRAGTGAREASSPRQGSPSTTRPGSPGPWWRMPRRRAPGASSGSSSP